MKKKCERILAAVLFFVFLVAAVALLLPKENSAVSLDGLRVRITVKRFLRALKKENYDRAAEFVSFFDENGTALESTEELRCAWSARVKELRDGDSYTYLDSYSDLRVTRSDGVYRITVNLSVMRQGSEDRFYLDGSAVSVIREDGSWKILGISDEPTALQTPFEQAVSGLISADPSDGE